jgi:RNA polymerase sigma-70 factor (ECF subfamily)
MDQLLTAIQPLVHRWALANAANIDEADDIAQHALIMVYRKLRQFRGDAPLEVWVYRITTRIARQRHRKRTRRAALDVHAHADQAGRVYTTDPGARVDRERLTAVVRECYAGLPPQQRAAITLVDFDGRTPAEAAVLMELGASTLRANLFKARASIRRRVLSLEPALAERFANVANAAAPTSKEAQSQ